MTTVSALEPTVAPVRPVERIQIIDVLRGFALFGILLVNMAIFSHPFQSILFPTPPDTPWHDRFALWLIHFLGEGKFYSLFSLLFGLGMVLQMERIESRGRRFVPLYARRLLVLLLIGVVHAFLIWPGDILIIYALLGFPLLLFRKAKPRTLLIWVVALLVIPWLLMAAGAVLVALGRMTPEGAQAIEQSFAIVEAGYRADLARAEQVYATGSFWEITGQRVYDYMSMGLSSFFVLGFNILAMFLLGAYFAKRRIFNDLEAHRPLFRQLLIWGGVIGLTGNAIYATLIMELPRYDVTPELLIATVAQGVGAPLLMLAYVSAICLLALRPSWGSRLQMLAPLGRMALSNYLLQSIVCTLIFYSYGLGLFGKVGAAWGIALTVVIYLLQIPLSQWWMSRFLYGPAEWLWRSLTYGKMQPMRLKNNSA
ncbi:DUF418 domain-containing protein [Caldilinea sp.]|uniref:DUF418 domain-containing protein n=1 Tax=Caldilinea sp. TaxID=2293560 RepID=UPI0021DE3FE8|nr:DUF418 domain-containing protein [Caldilinea sp.]GIV70042.1 MAG: hypothetical protein KatS3mg048_2904 [Caldilinea sp.]